MEFQLIADIVVRELRAELTPELIVIYGSIASGTFRSDSDVDVAYLGGSALSDYERFLLAQRLAGILNRDIDLVDLAKASTVLQMQIVNKGTVVYCHDDNMRQEFEMLVYKMYARLNEERHEVLRAYEQGVRSGE